MLPGLKSGFLILVAFGLPLSTSEVAAPSTAKPWPTCLRVPVRCDPTTDPFATTTTWRSHTP